MQQHQALVDELTAFVKEQQTYVKETEKFLSFYAPKAYTRPEARVTNGYKGA
jgi:hypothetical protein